MKQKPICKIKHDGTKEWRLNGKCHREDGPAVEFVNGDKAQFLNGKCHREGLPAVEYTNGNKYWYLNGEIYSEPNYYRHLYKLGKITKEELFIKLL